MATAVTFSTALQCAGTAALAADQQPDSEGAETQVTATGTNAVGDVLAAGLNEVTAKLQSAGGCEIFSINSNGSSVTVNFSTTEASKLVVGLYTDQYYYADGIEKMLASAMADVTAEDNSAELTFNISEIPESYVLKAYLIGNDGNLLSEEYVDESNTVDIKELTDANITYYANQDYEVLNLDDDNDTNFVVYDKNVKVLKTSGNSNVLVQNNDGTYTIHNISKALQSGNIVSVENGSDVNIFHANAAGNAGTDLTLTPSEDPGEAFEAMKIDMDSEDFESVDEDASSEESALSGDEESSQKGSVNINLKKDIANGDASGEILNFDGLSISFTGSVQLKGGLNYKFDYKHYQTKHHKKTLSSFSGSLNLDVGITGTGLIYFPIKHLEIPDASSKLGIDMSIGIYLKIMVSGTLSGKFEYSFGYDETGTTFHSDKGAFSLSASCFIGVALKGEGRLLDQKLKLELGAGLNVTDTQLVPHPVCSMGCKEIDVDFQLYVQVTYSSKTQNANYNLLNNNSWSKCLSYTWTHPLGKGHWCLKHGFQWGECLYKHAENGGEEFLGDDYNQNIKPNLKYYFNRDGVNSYYSVQVNKDCSAFLEHLIFPGWYNDGTNGQWPVRISRSGFFGCTNLKSVQLPETLTEIPEGAFGKCSSLEDITIPNSIKKIGNNAFWKCSSLESLVINANIEAIDYAAFAGSGLKSFTLNSNYPMNELKQTFSGCKNLEYVELNAPVQTIFYTFNGCSNLKSIRFPRNLETISAYTFEGCTALESIEIPDGVKEIGHRAFHQCTSLTEVCLPQSLQSFGSESFAECSELQHINFPSAIKEISDGAFINCFKLCNVVLPESLEKIGKKAFASCRKIGHIDFPSNLKYIDQDAFKYSSANITSLPENIQEISYHAFDKCHFCNLKHISDPLAYSIDSVVLPESLTKLNMTAFTYTNVCDLYVYNPQMEFFVSPSYVSSWQGNITRIYGYTGSTAEAFYNDYMSNMPYCSFVDITTLNHDAITTTTTTDITTTTTTTTTITTPNPNPDPVSEPQTITFTGLCPNTLYNYYDLLGYEFTSENLLYLSQGMSDDNGNLTIWYRPKADDADASKYVQCYVEHNGAAQINQTAEFRSKVYEEGATYQWLYLDNDNWVAAAAEGADTATMRIPIAKEADGQQYRCVVCTKQGNTVYSDVITLRALPTVIAQPADIMAIAGNTAQFTVTADGIGDLTYEWQYRTDDNSEWKTAAIDNADAATLNIQVENDLDGQQYRCKISDSRGLYSYSQGATIHVIPEITAQPENVTAYIDNTATFSVAAAGEDLSYKWQYNSGNGWNDSTNATANTAELKVTATVARNGYQYRCIVTSSRGSSAISDAATLTVQAKIIYNANGGTGNDVVQEHISGAAATLKSANTFTRSGYTFIGWNAKADGTGNPYAAGTEVTWKNNVTLYAQWVKNLTITQHPASVTKSISETATFSVAASGDDLSYQWQYNKGNGWNDSTNETANTANLKVTVTEERNGYQYRCIVTSSNGASATSNAATLTVKVASITYKANGGTGSDVVQNHLSGAQATLQAADSFTRSGYTFVGWNAKADGTGNSYAAGAKVTWKNDVTLYAQWAENVTITQHPADVTKSVNETAVFSVAASGEGLSYQWQVNTGNGWNNSTFSTATTAELNITTSVSRNGYQYRCIVTSSNGASAISNAATLTVKVASITYKANGGSGSDVVQNHFSGGQVTLNAADTFTRSGYTFTGWNAKADGTGNSYAAGTKVSWKNDVTLYAQWAKNVTITQHPANVTKSISETAVFSVAASGEGLSYQWQVNTGNGWGNSTFATANTAELNVTTSASRNGYQYRCIVTSSNGTSATSNAATLTVKVATITYNANGGTGSDVVQNHFSGAQVTLNAADTFTRSGYTFIGWNAKADGTGNSYAAGTKVSWKNDVTLYAQWAKDVTITQHPSDVTKSISETAVFSVAASGDDLSYQWQVNTGKGWNDSTNATANTNELKVTVIEARNGFQYRCIVTSSSGVSATSDAATLTVKVATITYKANGGTGSDVVQNHLSGGPATLQAASTFTRSGYTFVGWNAKADGTGNSYAADTEVSWKNNVTLYAMWEKQ